jgi:dsRNA-specific ribonuclease
MYYCSGTPKNGADYKDAAGAREAALKDLKKRAGDQQATSKIISSSDKTGYFAVASARTSKAENAQDIFAVGYGKSKDAAEKDASDQLARQKATEKKKVHYQYFSHGEDGK